MYELHLKIISLIYGFPNLPNASVNFLQVLGFGVGRSKLNSRSFFHKEVIYGSILP